MLEVRIHGRGGQGAQLACQILAAALFRSGRAVQAFAAYGGERRGAPVTAFLRAHDQPLRVRCDVERPHHLLVLDPTMLEDARIVADVRPGGLVIVNSPEALSVALPAGVSLVAVDATAIAQRVGLGPIVSTAMVGAFGGATGVVTPEDLAAAVRDGSPTRTRENALACAAAYEEAVARRRTPGPAREPERAPARDRAAPLIPSPVPARERGIPAPSVPGERGAESRRAIPRAADDGGGTRPLGWSEPGRTTLEIRTGGWRTRRPIYVEATAPCRGACPAAEPIARWIEHARRGDCDAAWHLIREENPFPAIAGRVCAHPCESACNRAHWDGAVAINALERFVGDWGLAHGTPAILPAPAWGRVAVVGGGPAGLACAYHLRRLGHPVDLFEAEARLGGLLRYGIPEYRLPRAVLDREIALALGPGIEVFTRRRLGDDLSWATLAAYDAVWLATGAALSRGLGVPGETARGVDHGLAFLRAVNASTPSVPSFVGERLVVVGGGSTAMDVARSARRLGVPSVTVLAIEAREDMPALPEEVTQALAEGVEIANGVGVSAISEAGGLVTGIAAAPARLEIGEGGAVRPRFLPGPAQFLAADRVLLALGQSPDLSAVPAGIVRLGGLVAADGDGATSSAHVFAGGDLVSAIRTVTHAIGAGTRAARRIHALLSGRTAEPSRGPSWPVARPGHVVAFPEINLAYFRPVPRAGRRERSASQRVSSFGEAVGGLAEAAALAELSRCFQCGHCVGCDNCLIFCPDMAVARIDGGYRVSAEHCKGCGLCVEECPRGALQMASER